MNSPVVVVGGGLSGLVTAFRLAQRSVPVVIVEARTGTGGVLARGRVGGPDGPVLDLGAEAMLARRREGVDLAVELGLGDELVTPTVRTAAIYRAGRLHPMPRTLMGVPGDVRDLEGLLTTDELAALAARGSAPGHPVSGDITVGDWVRDRLGTAVLDRLVEPLLAGVYAGSVDRLSLRATVPQLWAIAESGNPVLPAVGQVLQRAATVPGAGSPVFVGIRGGVARLAQRLTERLQQAGVEIRTGTCVTALIRTRAGWRVGTRRVGDRVTLSRTGLPGLDGSIDASGVVLAVPAPTATRLLAGARTSHGLVLTETAAAATVLARVEVASMGLVSLLLAPGALDAVGNSSGVLVPSVERRAVKAMTFSSRKWAWVGQAAGGRDVLRLSVGRRGEVAALTRSDADLVGSAVAEARQILGVELTPVAWRVSRWGGGLPQYDRGHLEAVAAVRESVCGVEGLEVVGAMLDGVGIPACIATAAAAAQRLVAGRG